MTHNAEHTIIHNVKAYLTATPNRIQRWHVLTLTVAGAIGWFV